MLITPLFLGDLSKADHALNLSPSDVKRSISLLAQGHFKLSDFNATISSDEYNVAVDFLYENHNTPKTFKSYRAAVEKLFLWAWNIKNQSVFDLRPADFNEMLNFYSSPPDEWAIAFTPKRRLKTGIINPDWKPIVKTNDAGLSPNSKKAILSSLSAFYGFVIDNTELCFANPALIARKKLGTRKNNSGIAKKILSERQVDYIFKACDQLPHSTDGQRSRVRFLMAFLTYRYRRISEASSRLVDGWQTYVPMMSDFVYHGGDWFFSIPEQASKTGVESEATVPPALLNELKRYRQALSTELNEPLTALPTPSEAMPLFPKINGHGKVLGGLSTSTLEKKIKHAFLYARELMLKDAALLQGNDKDEWSVEAEILSSATPHWLRHTGISLEMAKGRNIVHIRDDAMHSSIDTTNIYTNALDKARSQSAKDFDVKTNDDD